MVERVLVGLTRTFKRQSRTRHSVRRSGSKGGRVF